MCTQRLGGGDAGAAEPGRSDFHKDFDRIVFSSPFRRLGRKTQVHPLVLNDHIHTRLTHSIEVGSVGRSLGIRVGEFLAAQGVLPQEISAANIGEIVQAACLAHDIGNPPFGHAGEDAIRSWFKDQAGTDIFEGLTSNQKNDLVMFEGNALGFRVVTQTEYYRNDGGMRLTLPTLGALLKYPWSSLKAEELGKEKCSCFSTELPILTHVCEGLGLMRKGDHHWCRHPLSLLMEAADDICYAILDLEDAREMKMLSFGEIAGVLLPLYESRGLSLERLESQGDDRRKTSYLRTKVIGLVVDDVVDAFSASFEPVMKGELDGALLDCCSAEVREAIGGAKRLAREKVFIHPRKVELEIGAYTTLGILLDALIGAVNDFYRHDSRASFKSGRILNLMGADGPKQDEPKFAAYMRVLDYIGGMTDNYATHIAQQIGGKGGLSIR